MKSKKQMVVQMKKISMILLILGLLVSIGCSESKSAEEYYNEGLSLYSLGQYDLAIEKYNKALRIDPNYIEALNGKALSLFSLGKESESMIYVDKVLAIDPSDLDALNAKAILFAKKYDRENAIYYIDKAININPNDGASWANKALILYWFQDISEGSKCMAKARELGFEG